MKLINWLQKRNKCRFVDHHWEKVQNMTVVSQENHKVQSVAGKHRKILAVKREL